MFPQLTGTEDILTAQTDEPIPWTYQFDWETKQLKQGPDGRYLRTRTYAEYLQETVHKILHTRRFRYAIYSSGTGWTFGGKRPDALRFVIADDQGADRGSAGGTQRD